MPLIAFIPVPPMVCNVHSVKCALQHRRGTLRFEIGQARGNFGGSHQAVSEEQVRATTRAHPLRVSAQKIFAVLEKSFASKYHAPEATVKSRGVLCSP